MLLVQSVRRFVPHQIRSALRRSTVPLVTRIEWDADERLVLSGSHRGSGRPGSLILRHRKTGREQPFPLRWSGHRFTVELPVARLPVFGAELPLATGVWQVLGVRLTGKVPGRQVSGTHEFLPVDRKGRLLLHVRLALGDDERGPGAQELLQVGHYERCRRAPVREAVLFDSFEGGSYACNPRALFEEMRRQELGLEYVWVSAGGQFAAPDGAQVVLKGSREHYDAIGRSRLLVGNQRMPAWFRKREGQFYLQTWHGTPLKTLGRDITHLVELRTQALERASLEVPQWDLVLSPNPHTTPIMRSAYAFDGEIAETGYPRNDLLRAPGREVRAAAVRRELGLAEGKRVVLYAPTWRDDVATGSRRRPYDLALDLDEARRALGGDHVLLLRAHHKMGTGRDWRHRDGFVVDASFYPDIADLYLVADVLITDYSSSMFDFAGTGKPILLFTYDLERYRDQVHGFYFDLAAEAPGPLLRTSAEVVAALRAGDTGEYRRAHAAFAAKYCPYDDGFASARVIQRVLKGI